MRQTLTPVMGLPSSTGWSQVFQNADASVVIALAVSGNRAPESGKALLTEITASSIDSAEMLHQVLNSVINLARKQGVELSLAVRLLLDTQLVSASYNASILLKRAGKVGVLLESPQKLAMVLGKPKATDITILLVGAARALKQEISQKFEHGYAVDSIILSLTPDIQQAEEGAIALAFIDSNEAEKESLDIFAPTGSMLPREEVAELVDSSLRQTEPEVLPLESIVVNAVVSDEMEPDVQSNAERPTKSAAQITALLHSFQKQLTTWGTSVTTKLRLWLQRGLQRFQSLTQKQTVYLESIGERKQFVRRLALVVFVLVASLALIFGFWQRRSQQLQAVQSYVEPIQTRLDQAQELRDSDPIQARQLTEQSLEELAILQEKFAEQRYALHLLQAKTASAQAFFTEISGKEELQNLSTFFDLRSLSGDFITTDLAATADTVYFLDAGTHTVLRFNLSDKTGTEISLDAGTEKSITAAPEGVFVLADGMYQLQQDKEFTQVKAVGDSNKEGTILATFSDYLYVFNPEKRNIYRYAPSTNKDEAYSDPIGWLQDKQGITFDDVVDMQVDGDIWLSTKEGAIFRYSQGQKTDFTIAGLSEAFSSPLYLFTREDLETLYVLEPEKQRIVILQKNGEFLREIKSPTFSSSTEIFLGTDPEHIFVVSGSLVYELPLQ